MSDKSFSDRRRQRDHGGSHRSNACRSGAARVPNQYAGGRRTLLNEIITQELIFVDAKQNNLDQETGI